MAKLTSVCCGAFLFLFLPSLDLAARVQRQGVLSRRASSGYQIFLDRVTYTVDASNASSNATQPNGLALLKSFFAMQPNSVGQTLSDALVKFGVKHFSPWYVKFAFKGLLTTRWIARRQLGIMLGSVVMKISCPRNAQVVSKACRGLSDATLKVVSGIRTATTLLASLLENDVSTISQPLGDNATQSSLVDRLSLVERVIAPQDSGNECTVQLDYPEADLDCILSIACYPCFVARPNPRDGIEESVSLNVHPFSDGWLSESVANSSANITAQLDSAAPTEIPDLLNQHNLHLESFGDCLEPIVATDCVD